MVPPCKAREFTKHKQVIIDPLPNGGWGVAGVDVVVVSIGELLISDLTERRWLRAAVLMIGQIASFFLIARTLRAASTGAVSVGLVYHTLKNYKLCHLDT